MKIALAICAVLGTFAALPAFGLSLEFPAGANRVAADASPHGSVAIPITPFTNNSLEVENAEGAVAQEAWQVTNTTLSTLQIISPLRQQLTVDGFEILLDCADTQCGGFDFRYQINLLPEPEMHVDLGDFRYLSARRIGDNSFPEYVGLMVSRTESTGFIQLTHIGESNAFQANTTDIQNSDAAIVDTARPSTTGLAAQLSVLGYATLEDLSFETGSSVLANGDFTSLAELAAFLSANPGKKVALVGHTDAEGSLENNLALSRKRATSVMNRLISSYDVLKTQMAAAGVGFLAPRATNSTESGRTKNRRVEVILTSTP